MAIENLDEVKAYLESQKDSNEEVKNYLQGLNTISLDGVKSFLETSEEGKQYLGSYADARVTQGIETFKQKNLSRLVDEELRKRNPSTDPKDIQIEELKKQFEDMQKESVRKDLELKTSKIITEKHIPIDFMPYVIGETEELTLNNVRVLEKALNDYSQTVRGQILKDGAYTPHKSFNHNTTVNPYAKETFSLTKQMELERSNPEQAQQFKSQLNF